MKISLRLFWLFLFFFSLHAYGYDFVMGPLTYTILSEDDAKVEVAGPASTDITEAVIPQKVVYNKKSYTVAGIGYSAFHNCPKLTEVTIPNSVKYLDRAIFSDCQNLTNVILPAELTTIGDSNFYNCTSLSNIELPTTVKKIGEYAFSGTPITSLELPASVSYIGRGAFYDCDSLVSITVSEGTTTAKSLPESDLGNIICNSAFHECSKLNSVEIPGAIKTIGDYAFLACHKLETIKIPDSVTKIGESCFNGCSSLKSIDLPESIKTIGDFAFDYCYSLNSIILPASLMNIGKGVFEYCAALTSIGVDSDSEYFTSIDGILYNKSVTRLLACPSPKTTVTIPETVEEITDYAFNSCGALMSITIPESVCTIGEHAFYWAGISDVTIPKSVVSIGVSAFGSCSNMNNIYVDSANESFSSLDGILYDKKLTRVLQCPSPKTKAEIPETVEIIDESAFAQCWNLKTIDIPESVKIIGENAFFNCSALESISIPKSINEIGEAAFMYCSNLTDFIIKRETPLDCGYIIASETMWEATLYVPIGSKAAYEAAEPWKFFSNIVEKDFTGVHSPVADNAQNLRIVVNGDTATIDGLEDGEEIAIYDMSGRLIRTGKDHTFAGLARGIYIAKAGAMTVKFTI